VKRFKRVKLSRHVRARLEKQLSPHFNPGDVRYLTVTRGGHVIGAFETLQDAAVYMGPQRTIYIMVAERWLRGGKRVIISYNINKKPPQKTEEEGGNSDTESGALPSLQ
jgi:hypothetical protein